ncbi:MAG: hypothetical protein AAF125_13025, partial [Chloroflexota bacterium]
MFQLVQRRRYYFMLSGTIIGLGIAMMIYSTITIGSPFRLSIDFLGGSIYEFAFDEAVGESDIRDVFAVFGEDNIVLQSIGE